MLQIEEVGHDHVRTISGHVALYVNTVQNVNHYLNTVLNMKAG